MGAWYLLNGWCQVLQMYNYRGTTADPYHYGHLAIYIVNRRISATYNGFSYHVAGNFQRTKLLRIGKK